VFKVLDERFIFYLNLRKNVHRVLPEVQRTLCEFENTFGKYEHRQNKHVPIRDLTSK
jgi:hypothetical protein